MFAVQTFLVVGERFEKIAEIGISLAIISLFQWVADGGGVYYLSKVENSAVQEVEIKNFILARIVFSILFLSVFLPVLFYGNFLSIFCKEVIYFSAVVSLIWSFNLTGIADARNENRFIGPASGLSWLFSSICTLFFIDHDSFSILLGTSFSVGLLITLLIQISVLKVKYSTGCFRLDLIISHLKDILGFNVAYIVAQSYGRVLIILVDFFVGAKIAGMYLYAKSFSNFTGQFVVFTRRVEFPSLLNLLKKSQVSSVEIFRTQLLSILSVLISFLICVILKVFVDNISSLEKYSYTAFVMVFVSLAMVFWAFASSLGQVFIALNKNTVYAKVISSTAVASVALCYFSLKEFHGEISFIIAAEVVMYIVQLVVYMALIKIYSLKG
jgi:O-antigen/teichoic acid export membrane protein